MTPRLGVLALLAGLILAGAGWFPAVLAFEPWSSGAFDRPTDLAFTTRGQLQVLDRDGARLLTLDAEGRLVDVRPSAADRLGRSTRPQATDQGREAWQAGLDGIRFEAAVSDPEAGEAALDPWKSVILWHRDGRPDLVLEGGQVPWGLRVGVGVWDALVLVLGLALLTLGFRSLWQWVLKPGSAALKSALLVPPILAVAGVAGWALIRDAFSQEEFRSRQIEMTLMAEQASTRGLNLDFGGYDTRIYNLESGTLVPRPHSATSREYWAALRQGRAIAFRHPAAAPRYLSVVVPLIPVGDRPLQLLEIRWDQHKNQGTVLSWTLGTGFWISLGGLGALYTLLVGLVHWLRRGRAPEPIPFEDDDPYRSHAPGRWVSTLGPDVLASLRGGRPLVRRATLATWVDTGSEAWAQHLGHRGALEVPTPAPLRRVLFFEGPRPLAEALEAWTEPPPPLKVEAVRVSVGFVDTGFRFLPLVTGLPPASALPPGIDARTRKKWPGTSAVAKPPAGD